MTITPYCRWANPTTTFPAGITPSNLVCLYQFTGSPAGLTDRSGNGHNLTLNGGTEVYAPNVVALGVNGLEFRTNRFSYGPAGLYPGTPGALTVEAIWTPGFWTVDDDVLFSIIGNLTSGLEEDNRVVELRVHRGGRRGRYGWAHEYGVGSDEEGLFQWSGALGNTHYVALTRGGDGKTYKLYLAGELAQTLVATNACTGGGGSDVRVRVAGYSTGNDIGGVIHSLRYTKEEFSADQIMESYLACRDVYCAADDDDGGGWLAGTRFRMSYDPDRRSGPRQQDGSLQSDLLFEPGMQGITSFDGGTLDS